MASPASVSFICSVSSTASRGKPPGRNNRGLSVSPTMVLSTPTAHAPASTTAAILPERPAATCPAVVAVIFPEGFADGAAKGHPLKAIISRAMSWSGQRTASEDSPALAKEHTGLSERTGNTRVMRPAKTLSSTDRPHQSNEPVIAPGARR